MNSRISFFGDSLAAGLALIVAGSGAVIDAQGPIQSAPRPTGKKTLSSQQLDNLVAPIALYSDPLLSGRSFGGGGGGGRRR
jgi:hypothetical protein